jgi:hypothetical protein
MKDTSLVPSERRGSLLAYLSSGRGVIITFEGVVNEAAETPHTSRIVVAVGETFLENRPILVEMSNIWP